MSIIYAFGTCAKLTTDEGAFFVADVYFYRHCKNVNKLSLIDRILNRKIYLNMCGVITDKIAFQNVMLSTLFLKYLK